MPFQVKALPREPFEALFDLTDEQLKTHRAVRVFAEDAVGFPERISLQNARCGDELLLVNFEHQDADGPYRSSHAVYVGKSASPADLAPNTLPPYFRGRAISLRAFDVKDMIVGAELVTNKSAAPAIEALLAEDNTAYIHAHFAKFGCFAARIERVGAPLARATPDEPEPTRQALFPREATEGFRRRKPDSGDQPRYAPSAFRPQARHR